MLQLMKTDDIWTNIFKCFFLFVNSHYKAVYKNHSTSVLVKLHAHINTHTRMCTYAHTNTNPLSYKRTKTDKHRVIVMRSIDKQIIRYIEQESLYMVLVIICWLTGRLEINRCRLTVFIIHYQFYVSLCFVREMLLNSMFQNHFINIVSYVDLVGIIDVDKWTIVYNLQCCYRYYITNGIVPLLIDRQTDRYVI